MVTHPFSVGHVSVGVCNMENSPCGRGRDLHVGGNVLLKLRGASIVMVPWDYHFT
jgi:hypothetical protein